MGGSHPIERMLIAMVWRARLAFFVVTVKLTLFITIQGEFSWTLVVSASEGPSSLLGPLPENRIFLVNTDVDSLSRRVVPSQAYHAMQNSHSLETNAVVMDSIFFLM